MVVVVQVTRTVEVVVALWGHKDTDGNEQDRKMVRPFALTTELGSMLMPATLGGVHVVEGAVPPQALSFSKANSHSDPVCLQLWRQQRFAAYCR